MHRSRLTTVFIDCDPERFERGTDFWSQALGKRAMPMGNDPRYVSLRGRVGGSGGPYVALQRVPADELGYHLDIETDDIEAEIARLSKLGATIKARIRNHVVMLAPTGHAFCIVPVYRPDFDDNATTWNED